MTLYITGQVFISIGPNLQYRGLIFNKWYLGANSQLLVKFEAKIMKIDNFIPLLSFLALFWDATILLMIFEHVHWSSPTNFGTGDL